MRVLFLTQTGPEGASARYRVYAYLPFLEKAGISADVLPARAPIHPGDSLPVRMARYATRFATRLRDLPKAEDYDLVVLQRDLINHLAPWLEQRLARTGVPLLLDVDDAIHLRPPGSTPGFLARAFGSADKLADLVPLVASVLAGNEELADAARARGARRVRVLPTAVDLAHAGPMRPPHEPGEPFVLGWVGSPGTLGYLEVIRPALEELGNRGGYRLRVIGASAPVFGALEVESLPWSVATENETIAACDVGIMPLFDDAWSRAKCGTKLLQYMALGVPALASPVGTNITIADEGRAALLASANEDWIAAIERLRTDAALRTTLRERGRRRVEEHYSVQALAPRLIAELRRAVGERGL